MEETQLERPASKAEVKTIVARLNAEQVQLGVEIEALRALQNTAQGFTSTVGKLREQLGVGIYNDDTDKIITRINEFRDDLNTTWESMPWSKDQ